jgi:hypothetical protein
MFKYFCYHAAGESVGPVRGGRSSPELVSVLSEGVLVSGTSAGESVGPKIPGAAGGSSSGFSVAGGVVIGGFSLFGGEVFGLIAGVGAAGESLGPEGEIGEVDGAGKLVLPISGFLGLEFDNIRAIETIIAMRTIAITKIIIRFVLFCGDSLFKTIIKLLNLIKNY